MRRSSYTAILIHQLEGIIMLRKRIVLTLVMLALLITPAALAQDMENPTIAILRYGRTTLNNLTKKGILDMLEAYQFINADERALLHEEEDLEGERINIFWGDAGMDLPTANIMVENALDRGADILLTLHTPLTQVAANLTLDLEQPPLIFFSIVSAPYTAGIADAPCIKPGNITGTQAQVPYDQFMPLARLQDPDISTIGVLVNAAEPNSVFGVAEVTKYAEALGITVVSAPIASLSDVPVATESLLDSGVEALLVSFSTVEYRALSSVLELASEYGVVTIGNTVGRVNQGSHIGAGFEDFYREGVVVGRMLTAHLEGSMDVAALSINALPSFGVALNLDAAAEAGIQFSDELLKLADYVIENGESTQDLTPPSLPDIPLEERRAADLEFLAGLECTPEIIAAQQAALERE